MPPKWDEIASDEEFLLLPEEEKSKVRGRYFENVIKKDPEFASLGTDEQDAVHERFFGFARQKTPLEKITEFLIEKPAEGAEVIREKIAGTIAPTEQEIEQEAQKTGETPLGMIAGRTAAQTLTQLIPMTPAVVGRA